MRNPNEVKAEISKLQAIQKTHSPTDSAWMVASDLLQPLFDEMEQIQRSMGFNSL